MTDQVLKLENAAGFLRKISINVLNRDAAYTLFTLPIEGVPLTEAQLDEFMGHYTFRSWYEQHGDGSWHPMPWWSKRDAGNFELDGKFVCKTATVTIEGTDYLFEEYCVDEDEDAEPEDEDKRPAARISKIKLKPTAGGTTLLSFHMQVRALRGKSRDELLDHMYRNVAVTFGETTAAGRKPKQESLALGDQTGHQSPPPIASKGGDAIDAELHARHPEASAEVMGADATNEAPSNAQADTNASPAPDLEVDVAKFEEGAKARLNEFQQRATGAIDGTTMRGRGGRRRRGGEDIAH
jgi:hypothetical protein